MKKINSLFIILLFFNLSSCQKDKNDGKVDEKIIVTIKENRKYDITAIFHGINLHYGDDNEMEMKVITYVVFRDNKSGTEIKYNPKGINNSEATGIESIVSPNFYFTEVWSPDEEYAVLPMEKFDGFGIFKSKNILESVKNNSFADVISAKGVDSGNYWHDFEKWEDDSTFSFRAGLDGDMFAFKYNLAKSELYCFHDGCEKFEIGKNLKGVIKPVKKGNIEILKVH